MAEVAYLKPLGRQKNVAAPSLTQALTTTPPGPLRHVQALRMVGSLSNESRYELQVRAPNLDSYGIENGIMDADSQL